MRLRNILLLPLLSFIVTQWLLRRNIQSDGITANKNDITNNFIVDVDERARRPRNLHLAFLGDSLCRQQYMSLIHFLMYGVYPTTNESVPNYYEGGFASRQEHRDHVSSVLKDSEICDCYCPEGPYRPWGRTHRIWANSYYRQEERNNFISYVCKNGYFESHGHWDPRHVLTNTTYRTQVRNLTYPPSNFSWQTGDRATCKGNHCAGHSWELAIRMHISLLIPKPKYVVINAGLWPHDLLENNTLSNLREALDDANIIGIYKTTTKKLTDDSVELVAHDIEGCKHLHYCMDMSWTGNIIDSEEYMDNSHFKADVTRKFNEQLFGILQNIQG